MKKSHAIFLTLVGLGLGGTLLSLYKMDAISTESLRVEANVTPVSSIAPEKALVLQDLKSKLARHKAQKAQQDLAAGAITSLHTDALAYQARSEETDRRREKILAAKPINSKGEVELTPQEREELQKILETEQAQQEAFLNSYHANKWSIK